MKLSNVEYYNFILKYSVLRNKIYHHLFTIMDRQKTFTKRISKDIKIKKFANKKKIEKQLVSKKCFRCQTKSLVMDEISSCLIIFCRAKCQLCSLSGKWDPYVDSQTNIDDLMHHLFDAFSELKDI